MRKIKQDREYFCVNSVDEDTLINILNERSEELMDDAVNELQPQIAIGQNVDFLDKDDEVKIFNFKLTSIEEDLISDMMIIKYFDEELIKLKTIQKYLGNDIKMFSPAEERRTFVNMVSFKRGQFLSKLEKYNMRNRLTGKFLLPY